MDRESVSLLLFASAVYGLGIIVVKEGLNDGLHPLVFSFLRTLFCLVLVVPLALRHGDTLQCLSRHNYKDIAIVGIIAEGLVVLVLFVGQKNTSAVNAGFLIRLTFLFTFPFAYILLKEDIGRIFIAVAAMMLGGAFLISTGGNIIFPMLGDIFVVMAAIGLGFTNAYAKKTMAIVPADLVTVGRFFFGTFFLLVFLVPHIHREILTVTGFQWGIVLLSSVLYTGFVVAFYRGISLAGPNIASLFFTAGSVFSALFAVLLLGEHVTYVQIVGALLLIGGGALVIWNN
ncbi:MAG: DMT family transporter [Candidatus Methanofastidiosia archaeon]